MEIYTTYSNFLLLFCVTKWIMSFSVTQGKNCKNLIFDIEKGWSISHYVIFLMNRHGIIDGLN